MHSFILLFRKILGVAFQRVGALSDLIFRKGCDFSTWVEMDDIGFGEEKGNKYQPSSVRIDKIIRKLYHITGKDSIIDIGCGKGYAMYRMHKLDFGAIDGYDLNPKLVETANDNFKRLGYDNCHATCADAETFGDYDRYNYFYMFNAVPPAIFTKMLGNIEASLERNPRNAFLILTNPECHDIVCRSESFTIDHKVKGLISWLDVYCYKHQC